MISLILAIAVSADVPAAQPTPPHNDKMVCRHIDETGTRLGRRTICKTEAEWRAEQEQAQAAENQRQRGTLDLVPLTGPPKPE